jgi:hypothetical protein
MTLARTLRAALLSLATFALGVSLAACSASEDRVIVHTATGDYTFRIEIADTNETRQMGLMFRQELSSDAGMLFDFFEERQASFWMRNTLIPLDMIFIASDGTVRNVHVNARPQDPTSILSDGPVRFVLEIPGGRSVEIGIAPGDLVEHPRMAAASGS